MTGTLHPVDPLTYSPDETYQRVLIVTGDPIMADKARQALYGRLGSIKAVERNLYGQDGGYWFYRLKDVLS